MSAYRGPELLTADHDTARFDCGDETLNEWLRRRAPRNQREGASRTWVVTHDDRVVAFYASSTAVIARTEATGRAARKQPDPLPAMLLGRLAVDHGHQGKAYAHEALMEHVTMATASRLGVRAPSTGVIRSGDLEAIVVTRYDRAIRGGRLMRIHQEDLCQASGLHPDYRYQRDGGPSPTEAASLLRRVVGASGAAAAVDQLRDLLVLQWLVVHADAHAKNFSILLAGGNRALAPLYDACTWLPYRRRTPIPKLRTAMKIGSDYRISTADRAEALIRLADALGLGKLATARRAEELAAGLPDALHQTAASLPAADQARPIVADYITEQAQRARRCEQIAETAARRAAPRRAEPAPGLARD